MSFRKTKFLLCNLIINNFFTSVHPSRNNIIAQLVYTCINADLLQFIFLKYFGHPLEGFSFKKLLYLYDLMI